MKFALLASLLFFAIAKQQPTSSGIQFFSLEQDMQIGSESAAEADATLPLVQNPSIEAYFRNIGTRLAAFSPTPGLRHTFRIVNAPSVNALTFPGGKVYMDRGLIDLAENEHQIAALLAHEIAHAAARHGTRQLSGQLLVQAPASVLAGLTTREGWKEQLGRLGIYLGARASFLRYSPEQEIEANAMAVSLLSRAGYSPYALPAILEKINTRPAEEKRLPAYAYNHPQGSDAGKRLDGDIADSKEVQRLLRPSVDFKTFHDALARLPFPAVAPLPDSELPNEFVHPTNYYRLRYPDGWQVRGTAANGGMIAPPGGIVSTSAGEDLTTGVMFDLFAMPEGQQLTLDQATRRLIVLLRQRNQELRVIPGAESQMLMGTEPALRTVLAGSSKAADSPRRPPEFVWVATRMYHQSLFYIVCVAHEDEFPDLQPIFEEIIRSVELL